MVDRRSRRALFGIALCAGALVYLVARVVYPHHTPNHDEGVYLQQAALLLDGTLWLTSEVPDAVRPWFFVEDGARLYSKYTPVTAAVFALGMAVGVPRLSLVVVAIANVALVGLVTAEAFDERTGVVAAVLLVASPLFLLNSAAFLSYAPATAFNLAFALGYLRAWRRDDDGSRRRYAVLAGVAIGVAFFARPFTAVLFATPFVIHATGVLVASWRSAAAEKPTWFGLDRPVVERTGIVAVLGLSFVGLTLAYNHVVTGQALLFPYEAFAPADGPGFGTRRIVGYERQYTPSLALESNALVLRRLLADWTAAAPLGSVAAAVGVGGFLVRARRDLSLSLPRPNGPTDLGTRSLLLGILVSVTVGNVFFWGNLNLLAALDDPTDGLISLLGPFYHFDLLLPLSAFGAAGLLATVSRLRTALRRRTTHRRARIAVAVALLSLLVVGGVAEAAALGDPIDRSEPYTERYDRAYEPFADSDFENAVVFVPTPYGGWLNHPFQSLRNDGDLDGPVVYAQDRTATGNFRVLDAYPDRTPYRYTYRGAWTSSIDDDQADVEAALQPLSVRTGDSHRIELDVGRVVAAESATIRMAAGNESVTYAVESLQAETVHVEYVVEQGRLRLNETHLVRYSDRSTVDFADASDVTVTVTFTQPGGSTVTYRQAVAVRTDDESVSVVWPPETRVCRLVTDCGYEGTYLPDGGSYPAGTSVSQAIETRADDHSEES